MTSPVHRGIVGPERASKKANEKGDHVEKQSKFQKQIRTTMKLLREHEKSKRKKTKQ
jgi:hypothetical protein